MSCVHYSPSDTEAVTAALLWTEERGVYAHAVQIRRVEFITGREVGNVPYPELFETLARFLDYLHATAYSDRYGEPLRLAYSADFKPKLIRYDIAAARRCLQSFEQGGGWTYQAMGCDHSQDIAAVERVTESLHSRAWAILQAEVDS
jgi:hypothetical protein